MEEFMLIKFWYGGRFTWTPKVSYVGGSSTLTHIDVDKLSYFELTGYVKEYGSYTNDDFDMYYLTPGSTFDDGLGLLKHDHDVFEMLSSLAGETNIIVKLYVEGEIPKPTDVSKGKESKLQARKRVAQPKPISPPKPKAHVAQSSSHANPSPSGKFTKATASRLNPSPIKPVADSADESGESGESGESDDSEDEEFVGSDQEEVAETGSDTDDDEWHGSIRRLQQAIQDERAHTREIVAKVIADNATFDTQQTLIEKRPQQEHSDSPQSSYEESDGDVLSPGESEDDNIRGTKYIPIAPKVNEFTDWSKWQWVVGTRFESREAFKSALRNYAVTNGRNVTISTSTKKKLGRLGVTCVQDCPFRLYVSFHQKLGCFILKSAKDIHTCQRNMSKNRQLSQRFLAETFLPVFNTRPHWTAKEIQDAVKEKFKVLITRWQAYNAKRLAHSMLHGSMKDHYSKIGSYLAALREANPSSSFVLETVPSTYFGNEPGSEVFFRLFVCFDGVRRGFLEGCRKLLCLDGCFLKTFLGGMLLAAIGRDANDQMFPVAWAVVEGENTDSWTWFMDELRKTLQVTNDGRGYTLISDQQKGLLNAVAFIWPEAEHRKCARHIYANWHKKHKGDDLKECFWKAVRAYAESDFKVAIQEMKELSPEATEDFLKQNLKAFCRCYIQTSTKTDVIVNNMAETFNGYIVKSRSKHIINMLEDIRVAIMTRLTRMKTTMLSKQVVVCPRIQIKLDKEKDWAYRCEVYPSSSSLFQVKDLDDVSVDLANNSCSCKKWNITGIPCHHACAVMGFVNRNSEELVHGQYLKSEYLKCYAYTIPPLPSQKYWPHVDFPLEPPPIKSMPGRPKKNRRKDPHEDPKKPGRLTKHGTTISCSICKGRGHNKRRCPIKDKGASGSQSASVKRGASGGHKGPVRKKGKQMATVAAENTGKKGPGNKVGDTQASQASTQINTQPCTSTI